MGDEAIDGPATAEDVEEIPTPAPRRSAPAPEPGPPAASEEEIVYGLSGTTEDEDGGKGMSYFAKLANS